MDSLFKIEEAIPKISQKHVTNLRFTRTDLSFSSHWHYLAETKFKSIISPEFRRKYRGHPSNEEFL
jgi:hypothetical protein